MNIKPVVNDFKDRDGNWVKSFRVNGRHIFTMAGKLHNNMMSRCVTKSYKAIGPTYEHVKASENFSNFQFFAEWCQLQVGYRLGWPLEKDLLGAGRLEYHEDYCVFLPRNLNMLLIGGRAKHGLPSCVERGSKGYRARFMLQNVKVRLEVRSTPEEAFADYKEFKELYMSGLAEIYKGKIDSRAYMALKNYQVVNKSESYQFDNITPGKPIPTFKPKIINYPVDSIAYPASL